MQTVTFPEHAVRRISRRTISKAPPGAIDWLLESLKFSPAELKRLKTLNEKARSGTLTSAQAAEADALIAMGHQLDRLRVEAMLANRGSSERSNSK